MVQNQNTNSCLSPAAKAPSVLCSHPLLLPGGLTFSHCGSQLLQHLKVGGGWKKKLHICFPQSGHSCDLYTHRKLVALLNLKEAFVNVKHFLRLH